MTCCGSTPAAELGQGSEPAKFDLEEQRLRAAAMPLESGTLQSDFHVPAMHCAGCISKLEGALNWIDFVDLARANLSARRVSIVWRPEEGSARALVNAIENAGFDADVYDLDGQVETSDRVGTELLFSLGVAGFAAANIMLLSVSVWSGADGATRQLFHLISALIAIPAVAYAGRPFFRSALGALRRRQLNMDVPISLAVLISLIMSLYDSLRGREHVFFDASVMLLFFLLIGRYLDHRMREKARGAVSSLSRLAAKGAVIAGENGQEEFLPLDEVRPGMTVIVRPGERIPVDGTIAAGTTELDRSLVTGESEPVLADVGKPVEAGIVNLTSPITIRVTKLARDSFLAEVTALMDAAEQGKAKIRRIADSMARFYAPVVHLLAATAFVFWLVATGGDWHLALTIAVSVLIITCPCALGLAVPIVHVAAANQMFRRGILVKDGAVFEKLGRIDRIVFDKTGTLTLGHPTCVGVTGPLKAYGPLILSLAGASTHPAARAISRSLRDQFDAAGALSNIEERPGLGLEAQSPDGRIRLGRPVWVQEIAAQTSNLPETDQNKSGLGSQVKFAVECAPPIVFALEDALRPDVAETIMAFTARSIETEILSGDNRKTVGGLARALGIEDWSADQRPADKVERIQALSRAGEKILVVGDGINDGPALAAAYVSAAPSSGSDVGRLASDMVFTGRNLGVLLEAWRIARFSDRLVKQNFAIAIAYNCIAIPLAFLGFVTPLVAALAMSASSVLVVANSLRLNLMRQPESDRLGQTERKKEARQTEAALSPSPDPLAAS